jgi:hypothetical protein
MSGLSTYRSNRDDPRRNFADCMGRWTVYAFAPMQDEPTKLERFAERIAALEREASAKVAESFDPHMRWSNYGVHIANTIRARGEP